MGIPTYTDRPMLTSQEARHLTALSRKLLVEEEDVYGLSLARLGVEPAVTSLLTMKRDVAHVFVPDLVCDLRREKGRGARM